jgi:hypothetical protein
MIMNGLVEINTKKERKKERGKGKVDEAKC